MSFTYLNEPEFFKTLFAQGTLNALSIAASPLFAMLNVTDTWGGAKVVSRPMRYGLPQARSANQTKALAQRNRARVPLAQWTMLPGYEYATYRVGYQDILRGRKDPMAFGNIQQLAYTSTAEGMIDAVCRKLYGNGIGTLGQLGPAPVASGAGATLQFINKSDVALLEPDMELQFFNSVNNVNQPNLLQGGGSTWVTAINTNTGQFQVADNITGWAGVGANTFVIAAGDGNGYGSAVENGNLVGLGAYIPATDPVAGDNLWGVDRSVHPQKLAGSRRDARGKAKWEELQKLISDISKLRGRPDVAFASHEQLQDLIIGRDNLTVPIRRDVRVSGDAGDGTELEAVIGYSGVRIVTPGGDLEVYGDPFCPSDKIYVLQMDTWHLESMGAFPHVVRLGNVDGLMQEQDAYDVQGRLFAGGQMYCDAPAYNGVLLVNPVN